MYNILPYQVISSYSNFQLLLNNKEVYNILCGKEHEEKREDKQQEGTWMKGWREEDNKRYRDFLKNYEDRREEERMLQEADKSRKEKAKRREDHWRLLRLCVKEIKENEKRWSARKIKECERIKEEAKEDRLSIAREKKKRYGLKGLSKEENKRIKK